MTEKDIFFYVAVLIAFYILGRVVELVRGDRDWLDDLHLTDDELDSNWEDLPKERHDEIMEKFRNEQ